MKILVLFLKSHASTTMITVNQLDLALPKDTENLPFVAIISISIIECHV